VNRNPLFIDPFLAAHIQRRLAIEAALGRQRHFAPGIGSSVANGVSGGVSSSAVIRQSPSGAQTSVIGSSSTREIVSASPAKRISSPFASFADEGEDGNETQSVVLGSQQGDVSKASLRTK
jgi:hypothetical protein